MSTSLIERLRRYADLIEGELVAGAPRKVGDAADCASPLMREAATLLDAHASALRDAERLREALKRIAAIEDCYSGTDWQEIEEAREIARAALDDNTKGAAE